MKRKTLLAIIVLIVAPGYFKGLLIAREIAVGAHTYRFGLNKEVLHDKPPKLWIEIHDVSPGYGEEKLKEITDIIDSHPNTAARKVLFIIPKHGGGRELHEDQEFVNVLKSLEKRGYELGLHGYTHQGGIKHPELRTDAKTGREIIDKGLLEFEKAGLVRPRSYTPPGWQASQEVSRMLREDFDWVYYAFFIDHGNATLPYMSHEYTWHDYPGGGLKRALKTYQSGQGIFRLTLHLDAANTPENLAFLDEFLTMVEKSKLSG